MHRRHISSPRRGCCVRLWLSHVELLNLHHRVRRRQAAEGRFVLKQSKEFTTTPQQMWCWKNMAVPPAAANHVLTARVNNDVIILSGLDLDQHEPWWLQTFLPCMCIHHPCQKWHIYLTSPVLYDTHYWSHCKPETVTVSSSRLLSLLWKTQPIWF